MVTSLAGRPAAATNGRARRGIGYRPELDGLRALAIIAVVVLHMRLWFSGLPVMAGSLGVDLFFVLSGFLITTLLVEEHESAGRVHMRRFYTRRALRLLPALALALLLGAVVTRIVGHNAKGIAYPHAALVAFGFAGNWFQNRLGALAHTWSLGLEEQYYLVWPFVLALVLRRNTKPARMIQGLLFIAVYIAALRSSYHHANDLAPDALWTFVLPYSRADGVLIGSGLAILLAYHRGQAERILRDRVLCYAAVAGVAVIAIRNAHMTPTATDTVLPANLCFAVIIGHLYCVPTTGVARLLRTQPLPALGRISYGLYIFHYPIFFVVRRTVHDEPTAAITAVALSLATAVASYVLVERPVLRLKAKVAARREPAPTTATSSRRHPVSPRARVRGARALATP
jgi:peptidoglycan/LPS O-acetylase OafA/YrhL